LLPYIWALKLPSIRFFYSIVAISELLPLILFFFRKQKKNRVIKLAFICQLTSILSDVITVVVRKSNESYGGISLNVFSIVALVVLYFLYCSVVQPARLRKFILFSAGALAIYFIIGLFAGYDDSFNSLNVVLLAIVVIMWSILFFYEQVTKPMDENQLTFYSSPDFWVVCAYLIYFAGTFFLFIFIKINGKGTDTNFEYSYNLINGIFVVLKNVLLSVAMFTKNEYNRRLSPANK